MALSQGTAEETTLNTHTGTHALGALEYIQILSLSLRAQQG